MSKLKELLSKINVPTMLVCLFSLKCMFFGINIADAIVSLGLTGLYAYHMFLIKREIKTTSEHQKTIEDIKAEISGLKVGLNMRKTHAEQQKKDRRYF